MNLKSCDAVPTAQPRMCFHLPSQDSLRKTHMKNPASFMTQAFEEGQCVRVAQTVKNQPAIQEMCVRSLSREDPLEEVWLPTPVFLPGESHGQRSLVGYSP